MHPLLLNEPPIFIQPTLACKIGFKEAVIIQQVHYWLNPRLNKTLVKLKDRWWVYKNSEDWSRQFGFWSKQSIQRTLTSLQAQKLLLIDNLNRNKSSGDVWYSINYQQVDAFEANLDQFTEKPQIDRRHLFRQNIEIAKTKPPMSPNFAFNR